MGNWINTAQYDAVTEEDQVIASSKRVKPLDLSLCNENSPVVSTPVLTPVCSNAPKLLMADFDPRSPSSGINRTPICLADTKSKKQKMSKLPAYDPRSPTNDYNRTPVHVNKSVDKENDNENEVPSLDASLNVSVASLMLDRKQRGNKVAKLTQRISTRNKNLMKEEDLRK